MDNNIGEKGRMKEKSISKNIILNIIRTGSSVLFPLITFPYISRVLGVINYGKINFANSIVSYFVLFAAFGISNYAIREGAGLRNDRKKLNTFANQIFSLNAIFVILSYVLLILLLTLYLPFKQYSTLILIQSASFLFNMLGVEWLYSLYEDFFYITLRSVLVQVISLVLMFLFVKTESDYIIYVVIITISSSGAYIFNFFHSRKYVNLKLVRVPEWRTHLKPMFIMFCNTLTITIYVNSDTTILGIVHGDKAVGIYSVSVKIYTIIKQILNSIVTVTLPRLAFFLQEGRKEEYNQLLNKIIKGLFLLIMPAITGIFMLSDQIIMLVAGESYVSGAMALRILSLALGGAVFAYCFVQLILLPHKMDRQYLKATIISAVLNIGLNFIAIPMWGINGAALTTLIAEISVVINAIRYGKDKMKFDFAKKDILSCVIGCSAIAFICIWVKMFVLQSIVWQLVIAIVFSCILYLLIMFFFKNELIMDMYSTVKRRRR